MKQTLCPRFLIYGIISVFFFLAGCGTSPPARFYTLASVGIHESLEKSENGGKGVMVAIGPVEIPDYLDRPEIVKRADQNQLIISEFDLWGGSLKTDITRVLVENISILLSGNGVVLIPWKSTIIGGYRVPVIIERFDAMPNDNLVLKSRWVMIGKDGKVLEIIRETSVITPMKGRSYSSAVVAMSEALGELSKEIAAGIKSVVKNNDK